MHISPAVKFMKGRTACPKCKHEFVLDVPEDSKKHQATCPKCKNKFTIVPSSCELAEGEECYWEEHGEPRKTILSSIKPRTDKPMIAAILLAAVFALGLTTAVYSETFLESSSEMLSSVGFRGTVDLYITDISNNTLDDVDVKIGNIYLQNYGNGSYSAENISLGIKQVEFSIPEYKKLTREILVTPFITSTHNIKMEEGDDEEIIPFDTFGCSIILVIFSVFALLGTITCLRRRNLDIAGVGSILGIFSFGFLMIGSILSIIAFILIMMSKEEFEDGKAGKIF